YDESLTAWTLDEEVRRLAEHVNNVPTGGTSGNAMWQYFGLTKRGSPAETGSLEAKVDLLLTEVTKQRLEPGTRPQPPPELQSVDYFRAAIMPVIQQARISLWSVRDDGDAGFRLIIRDQPVTSRLKKDIQDAATSAGINVPIVTVADRI